MSSRVSGVRNGGVLVGEEVGEDALDVRVDPREARRVLGQLLLHLLRPKPPGHKSVFHSATNKNLILLIQINLKLTMD